LEERVRERTAELEQANAALQKEGAERRRAHEILFESEEKYRSVTQATSDAILVADSDGNIVSWNNGARLIFGFDEAEVMGQPITLLMPEGFHEGHRGGIERIRAGGERRIERAVEVVGRRKDGVEFPLELSLGVWETSRGSFFSGIMRDITERKQIEEERRIYANRLERSNSELQISRPSLRTIYRNRCAKCARLATVCRTNAAKASAKTGAIIWSGCRTRRAA
jgi:PAS domain S-box-containing protein